MKKIYTLFLTMLLVLSFTVTAFAGVDYWSHPQYNLSKIKTINLVEVEERNDSSDEAFFAADNSADMLKAALYTAAGKRKLNINEVEMELPEVNTKAKLLNGVKKAPQEVNMKVIINNIGYIKTISPAHYETVEKTVTRTITKSDGTFTTISEPVTEQKYVPQQNYYYGKSDIIYQLYDVETNLMIYNSRDNRLREFTYDPTSMVERSTKDFIKNILKTK